MLLSKHQAPTNCVNDSNVRIHSRLLSHSQPRWWESTGARYGATHRVYHDLNMRAQDMSNFALLCDGSFQFISAKCAYCTLNFDAFKLCFPGDVGPKLAVGLRTDERPKKEKKRTYMVCASKFKMVRLPRTTVEHAHILNATGDRAR